MKEGLKLCDLPACERPRERLRMAGAGNLSVCELLALIIERGQKDQNVLVLSQNLLARFSDLAGLKQASLEELRKVKGIGFATACKLQAVFKIGEKVAAIDEAYGERIKEPSDVYKLLKDEMAGEKKEHFKLLSLSAGNRVIKIEDISIGILNASLVHPREIFKAAVKNSAASLILVHNHPSGELIPSKGDMETTKRIVEAGKIMDIKVSDHVIIAHGGFFSFRKEGLI